MYVFLILAMEVSQGVVSYGADEGVGMGRATAEKIIGQMINEFADRCDVQGGMKTWDGGAPGVVANDAETFSFIFEYFSKICPKMFKFNCNLNTLHRELSPICYLLALLGAHHCLHVNRIRVKSLTFRRLMSYIYGAPILDVSRSHTTTQHSR